MARILAGIVMAGLLLAAPPARAQEQVPEQAQAQDGQSLADIRADLRVLSSQVEQIRAELVRTGAGSGLPRDPAPALTRLDQLEAELRRLTGRVDVVSNDITRIVEDATNRIGDIEFRLTELEGGDAGALEEAAPLGGGLSAPEPGPGTEAGAEPAAPELALSEQADFDAAVAAVEAGDAARGAALLDAFLATYPGGPLSARARFWRGEAQAAQGDWNAAARSYLDSFSGSPDGELAPRALYRLAVSLAELGKTSEACLTFAEVDARYPGSEAAEEALRARQERACQ